MEAKGFNDRYDAFRAAGYEVIGVSTDLTDRNDEFRAECGLDFPLVSDEDGVADDRARPAEAVRGLRVVRAAGHLPPRRRRGSSSSVWDVSDAGEHPEEVLAAVTATQRSRWTDPARLRNRGFPHMTGYVINESALEAQRSEGDTPRSASPSTRPAAASGSNSG